jgi:hypothetical protein
MKVMLGILIGGVFALLMTWAEAAETMPQGAHAGAWSRATAGAEASVQAQQLTRQQSAQIATQNVTVAPTGAGSGGGTTTIRTTPDLYAPPMNATAPCRIAVSGGVVLIGAGVSAGGSVEDDPCNLRETARLLSGIGQTAAAARVMCSDPRAAAALGEGVCPSSAGRGEPDTRAPFPSQSRGTICDQAALYDDPILAARNGCPGRRGKESH